MIDYITPFLLGLCKTIAASILIWASTRFINMLKTLFNPTHKKELPCKDCIIYKLQKQIKNKDIQYKQELKKELDTLHDYHEKSLYQKDIEYRNTIEKLKKIQSENAQYQSVLNSKDTEIKNLKNQLAKLTQETKPTHKLYVQPFYECGRMIYTNMQYIKVFNSGNGELTNIKSYFKNKELPTISRIAPKQFDTIEFNDNDLPGYTYKMPRILYVKCDQIKETQTFPINPPGELRTDWNDG